jgi:hypothetical protein
VEFCRPRWADDVLTATLTGDIPAECHLPWRTNQNARKTGSPANPILFTNRVEWTVAENRIYKSIAVRSGGTGLQHAKG